MLALEHLSTTGPAESTASSDSPSQLLSRQPDGCGRMGGGAVWRQGHGPAPKGTDRRPCLAASISHHGCPASDPAPTQCLSPNPLQALEEVQAREATISELVAQAEAITRSIQGYSTCPPCVSKLFCMAAFVHPLPLAADCQDVLWGRIPRNDRAQRLQWP